MKSPFKIGKNVTVCLFLCKKSNRRNIIAAQRRSEKKKKQQPETEFSPKQKSKAQNYP